jgi:class 3 adenylate cyclase
MMIWILFGFVGIISIYSFINDNSANILYSIIDMMAKFIFMIIIYDLEEQKYIIKDLINLECVDINSNILQLLKQYEKDNNLSLQAKKYIKFIKKKFNIFQSYSNFDYVLKENLKIELLKKILPYELEEKYLLSSIDKYEKKDNIFVLFLDIVSYSEIACNKSDEKLFKILNNIYTNFDIVLRKYNYLQKIETIGDCYMILSSLNNQINDENEIEMYFNQLIKFSEEVINLSNNILNIKIRIGINIGSVIIGILGLDIPRLCVIGNTVNKASRLESTSEPNKINISEDVYLRLKNKDHYIFVLKEDVYLKNIGTENTYLISIK